MSVKKLDIQRHLNEHTYPGFLLRQPSLIHVIYKWNSVLLQRNKIVGRELLKILTTMSGGKVFDAGCGEGMFIFPYASKFTNICFIGLDKNSHHIDFCQNYSEKKKLGNTSFICQNFEDFLPVFNVDLLLCIGTLQYVGNDMAALSNFYNSIKPIGKAIFYTPINGHAVLPFYAYFFNKKWHYEKSQLRQRIYSEKEIIDKIKAADFKILDKKYAYGKMGILGHEIYSLCLMGMGSGKWYSIFFAFALIFFLPFILALHFIDSKIKKNNGNGLLIVAQK